MFTGTAAEVMGAGVVVTGGVRGPGPARAAGGDDVAESRSGRVPAGVARTGASGPAAAGRWRRSPAATAATSATAAATAATAATATATIAAGATRWWVTRRAPTAPPRAPRPR